MLNSGLVKKSIGIIMTLCLLNTDIMICSAGYDLLSPPSVQETRSQEHKYPAGTVGAPDNKARKEMLKKLFHDKIFMYKFLIIGSVLVPIPHIFFQLKLKDYFMDHLFLTVPTTLIWISSISVMTFYFFRIYYLKRFNNKQKRIYIYVYKNMKILFSIMLITGSIIIAQKYWEHISYLLNMNIINLHDKVYVGYSIAILPIGLLYWLYTFLEIIHHYIYRFDTEPVSDTLSSIIRALTGKEKDYKSRKGGVIGQQVLKIEKIILFSM